MSILPPRSIIVFFLFGFCVCSNSQTTAIAPTGRFGVGRKTILWIDSSRTEIWKENGNAMRRVLVHVWYPANGLEGKQAEYFPNAKKIKSPYTSQQKQAVSSQTTIARENAPLAKKETGFPLILFSAGSGMPVFYYTTLFEELCSHGYIIAAIDHIHEGVGQVFPDGSVERAEVEKFSVKPGPGFIERAEEFYRRRVGVRTGDMQFVITQFGRMNSEDVDFRGKIDVDQIGALGHSIGGVAAVQATLIDERIKAAINYDGLSNNKPYFPIEGKQLNHPFLFFTKELKPFDEEQLKRANMNKRQDSIRMKYTRAMIDSVMALSKVPAYKITLKNVDHENFSDVVLFDRSGGNEGAARLELIRKYTLLFFDRFLKGKQDAGTDYFAPGVQSWGTVEKIPK